MNRNSVMESEHFEISKHEWEIHFERFKKLQAYFYLVEKSL